MNEDQMKWAAKHDWFLGALECGDGWEVGVQGEGESYLVFTEYRELRTWAGY